MDSIPLRKIMPVPMHYHLGSFRKTDVKRNSMLKKFLEKRRAQTVMGYRLKEPRPTWLAGFWAAVYFGMPFFLFTVLLDIAIEWFSGKCYGLWCYFQ
jgi:hypothetical protein